MPPSSTSLHLPLIMLFTLSPVSVPQVLLRCDSARWGLMGLSLLLLFCASSGWLGWVGASGWGAGSPPGLGLSPTYS